MLKYFKCLKNSIGSYLAKHRLSHVNQILTSITNVFESHVD